MKFASKQFLPYAASIIPVVLRLSTVVIDIFDYCPFIRIHLHRSVHRMEGPP